MAQRPPNGKGSYTSGGNLKTKYIIHTVGPIWQGGNRCEPELLAEAYHNSLRLTVSKGLKTVTFPSISTGAYRYPIEKASRIALTTVKKVPRGRGQTRQSSLCLIHED